LSERVINKRTRTVKIYHPRIKWPTKFVLVGLHI
jgi:hypothetical protein